MTISDETLSAFLDRELSDDKMAHVRDAIAVDPAVAERVAQLASVDALVRKHADAMSTKEMPENITRLLAPNNVVDLSLWNRTRRILQEHAALAASLALLVGLSAGYLGGSDSPATRPDLATWLDSAISGETVTVDSDTRLLARFTFIDNQQRYCRHYQLQTEDAVSENVACRHHDGWELVATAQTSRIHQANDYQLASSTALLDSTLDVMMQGQALSLDDETQLIQQRWR